MLYYSEQTKKYYETEKECEKAEKEFALAQAKEKELQEKKIADRKAAAERVEKAYKAVLDANKVYHDELTAFCKNYGAYHKSYSGSDIEDLFDWVFRF